MSTSAPGQPYEIRVQGRLDPRWSAWFSGVDTTPGPDGTTVVRAPALDQAALHGLLARIRDLGLPLISVQRATRPPPRPEPDVHAADPGRARPLPDIPEPDMTSSAPQAPARPLTRAVVQHRYGSPDCLTVATVPTPVPGPGEVLVRVRAASVNARDWHVMRGEPRLARLLDRTVFARRGPRVAVRGTDLAGVVEAVGAGVTRWRAGDAVFGEGTGTFAEHAVAPADRLAAVPDGLGFDRAAALPLAATTALLCLDAADPAPGARVLVNGASGGVGTFALQLARVRGLHVTAVVSPRNADLAAELGADRVVDYTTDDFTRGPERYDVVVDLVGNRSLRDLRRAVRPGGALVLSGGGIPGTGRVLGPIGLLVRAQLVARFSALRILTPRAVPTSDLLDRIADLAATEHLVPVIDRSFPLERAADALRYVEDDHPRAKVTVVVSSGP